MTVTSIIIVNVLMLVTIIMTFLLLRLLFFTFIMFTPDVFPRLVVVIVHCSRPSSKV